MKPKVIYLLHASGKCGGIKIVLEHVSRLAQRGWKCEVWAPARPPVWFTDRPVPWLQWPNLHTMGNVLRATRAHKVATWWQTAWWASQTIREDDKGFYLVQDDERSYSTNQAQADHILTSYDLGLQPITLGDKVTEWVRNDRKLNPIQVGIAIDHDMFKPLPMLRTRDRVFYAYRPLSGPNDLKGGGMVSEVIRLVRQKNPQASLVSFGLWKGPTNLPAGTPHIHLQGVSDAKLRELYSQCGVYLISSKHEGFCLPGLEAMACGAPVVSTYAFGNEEYCNHEVNCLMGRTPQELADHIVKLQTQHEYADRMGEAGRMTALDYQWDTSIDKLEQVFQ